MLLSKRRRYYTPREVAAHDGREGAGGEVWVSRFGRVYDLTAMAKPETASGRTLLKFAGRDLSHWFDPATGGIRTHISGESGLEAPYTPQGEVPHVPPPEPTTSWSNDFEVQWWSNGSRHDIGALSQHTRGVRVLNTLTQQVDVVEACEEETMLEVQERYREACNGHAASYTWKFLGRILDMAKTLPENGIPDDGNSFTELGVDGNEFLPTLFVYYNDDLTVN